MDFIFDILGDMKKNIGTLDRWIRAIIAIALALVAFTQLTGIWAIVTLVIATFTMYQAVSGWCFLYQLIGKNTCSVTHD